MNLFYDFIEFILPSSMREQVLGDLHEESYRLKEKGKLQLEINFIFIKRALSRVFGIYQCASQRWWEEWREDRESRKARLASIEDSEGSIEREQIPSTSSTSLDLENPVETLSVSQGDTKVNQQQNSHLEPKISLIIENYANNDTKEDRLKRISIKPVTPEAMKLFGIVDTSSKESWLWEDVDQHLLLPENQKWAKELLKHIQSLSQVDDLYFCREMLQSSEGKIFTSVIFPPVFSGDLIELPLTFIQQPSKPYVIAPEALVTLFTAIDLARRLQWEVCHKYLPDLDRWQQEGEEAIRKGLTQVKNSFENIEKDAEIRKKGETADEKTNEVRLQESFEPEEGEEIRDNMLKQDEYKQILLKAETLNSVDKVKVALTELSHLNLFVLDRVLVRLRVVLNKNSFERF